MSFGSIPGELTGETVAAGFWDNRPLHSIIRCFLLVAMLCFAGFSSTAQTYVPKKEYAELSEYLLSSEYRKALDLTEEYITRSPDQPFGYLLKAAVIHYTATDYEDYGNSEEFNKSLNAAEKKAATILEANEDDIWARYFLAAAAGLKGGWRVTTGDLLSGVMKGRSGANGMQSIIDTDSTFHDAYLMTGSYCFWRNRALAPVRWLPFVNADVKDAFRCVRLAIDRGVLAGPLANTVLMEMLLAQDPSEALKTGERLVTAYPDCRLFLWQLGEAYKKKKRFDKAVLLFSDLAARYDVDGMDDGSGQIRCWWKLAVLADNMNKKKECGQYLRLILDIADTHGLETCQHDRIEKARKMLNKLQ